MFFHYLDDFLYISSNKENVIRFIATMHKKDSKYKCIINEKKSMANFDLIINNEKINKINDNGKYSIIYFILFF